MRNMLKRLWKWLDNFWYHYHVVVLIVLFFVASGLYLFIDALKKRDPDFVIVYAGNTYGDTVQFHTVDKVFRSIVGDINGDGQTKLNYRIIVVPESKLASYDVDKEQQLNYSYLDKNVRLYIIERKFMEDKQAYFEPLTAFFPDGAPAGCLQNEQGEVCGYPLAGNKVAGEMDFDREDIFLGMKRVMDTEKNDALVPVQQEKAKEILQYIIQEGKE